MALKWLMELNDHRKQRPERVQCDLSYVDVDDAADDDDDVESDIVGIARRTWSRSRQEKWSSAVIQLSSGKMVTLAIDKGVR